MSAASTSTLRISHRTRYLYHQPVLLGPHSLMLRPREGHDLRLISTELTITPQAHVSWAQDVFGNSVATVRFDKFTDSLIIDSNATIQLSGSPWPIFDIAASAINYPFRYTDREWSDLGALTVQEYPDPTQRLSQWTAGFIRSKPTNTLALLKDLSLGISARIAYQSRDDEGTQTPIETLDRGWGSCRDFAVLLAEAARTLGFGARIASGYLYKSDPQQDAGSTHAWVEIYVPGAGWITFDPTNREVGNFNLIPTAVARDISQVMPVSGSFIGMTDAFKKMIVEVQVTRSTA